MNINIDLYDGKSIDDAIAQIQQYKQDLRSKTELLVQKTAERVEEYAAYELANHIDTGETLASLHTEHRKGSLTANVIVGGAAIWLEFGTGVVTNNSSVGGYVHPKGAELGVCGLGTYGQGHGADPNFHGIPATLFMWNSAQIARSDLVGLARGIYK